MIITETVNTLPKKRATAGFTLIEVLVALAITAVIGVVAYGGLDTALAAMERNEAQGKKLNEVNILLAIMSRDFRQVVPRPVRDEYGDGWEHAFNAPENALSGLQFSRGGWANPRPEQFVRSNMQRVVYVFEEEKIIRESWYVMDRASDSEAVRVAIVSGVSSFKVEYLDSNLEGSGATPLLGGQWRESWPYPYPQPGQQPSEALPLAVKVTMDLKGWGEIVRLFEIPASEK